MKLPHLIFVLIFALVTGCSTVVAQTSDGDTDKAASSLASVTANDLDAAVSIAKAHGDKVGEACFSAMKDWLAAKAPEQPKAAGVFSALELTRVGVARIRAGVPDAVHVACAPVIVDSQRVLLRLGLIAAGLK